MSGTVYALRGDVIDVAAEFISTLMSAPNEVLSALMDRADDDPRIGAS